MNSKRSKAKQKKKIGKVEKVEEIEDTDKAEDSEKPEQKKKRGRKDGKTASSEPNAETPKPKGEDSTLQTGEKTLSEDPDVSTSASAHDSPATLIPPISPPQPISAETPNESTGLTPSSSPAAASHSRAASFSANRSTSTGNLRRPSISVADILRSTNTRSPNALSPIETVPDIYRKQATTISELTEIVERLEKEINGLKEKENKANEVLLEKEELAEHTTSLRTSLEEYKFRFEDAEKQREVAQAEMEKLKSELESSTRQISHLSSQLAQKNKTISDLRSQNAPNLPDLDQEAVKEKENQIESMEMEISKLRIDFERSSNSLFEAQSGLAAAEEKVKLGDEAQAALQAQIDDLQEKMGKTSEEYASESAARTSAEAQVKSLLATIDAQNGTIKKLESTIASWEKDNKSLTQLYSVEADNTAQEFQKKIAVLEQENKGLSRQLSELRGKCNRLVSDNAKLKDLVDNHQAQSSRATGSMQADDDELDSLEADERRKVYNKIEELERLLQEKKRKDALHVGTEKSKFGRSSSSHKRSSSNTQGEFSEVEFLGNYPSIGEDDFLPSDDEEVYQQTRVNYSQRKTEQEFRLEREKRIAEIKAELMKWKGYKLDLTSIGGSFLGLGELFEI